MGSYCNRPRLRADAHSETARALLRTTKPPTAKTITVMARLIRNLRPVGRVRRLKGKRASSRRKNKKEPTRISFGPALGGKRELEKRLHHNHFPIDCNTLLLLLLILRPQFSNLQVIGFRSQKIAKRRYHQVTLDGQFEQGTIGRLAETAHIRVLKEIEVEKIIIFSGWGFRGLSQ